MSGNPLLESTAAVPMRNMMSVVTLRWNGSHLRLVPTKGALFELLSQDQAAIIQAQEQVQKFIADTGIGRILVRRGPSTGPRVVSRQSTRFEMILQLLPIECIEVSVHKVRAWENAKDWLLPLPRPARFKFHRDIQHEAIVTAAYDIACQLTTPSEDAA